MVASTTSDILERVIAPSVPDLSPDAARSLLRWSFAEADVTRMNALAAKAREGSLSADEQDELDGYIGVGLLIDLVQSKARLSLKAQSLTRE